MGGTLADLKGGSEVIFSLSAGTEEEVRAWADNAKAAGGTIFREAKADENGYYYCGFADPVRLT
jgi:predicted lactoylglutathione lyase